MMVFIICMIIIAVLSAIAIIYYVITKENIFDGTMLTKWDWLTFTGLMAFVGTFVISLVWLGGLAITNMTSDVRLAELQAQREMLIYRIDKEDNFLEDAQLKREVMDFNIQVRSGKQARSNIWINWFSSPAYDDIEEIEISFKD